MPAVERLGNAWCLEEKEKGGAAQGEKRTHHRLVRGDEAGEELGEVGPDEVALGLVPTDCGERQGECTTPAQRGSERLGRTSGGWGSDKVKRRRERERKRECPAPMRFLSAAARASGSGGEPSTSTGGMKAPAS